MCQIVLFGDDEPGAQQEAMNLSVHVLPMERTEKGAPLLPYIIDQAHQAELYDIRCLVNADIILGPEFAGAVEKVANTFDQFLLSARRIKVHVDNEIDFSDPEWMARLKALDCKLGISSAIDLFCYRGDWLRDVPPFGVGRTSWDNWMVRTAVQAGVPFIDGTPVFLAWHQEHEIRKPKNEINRNRALLGTSSVIGTFNDATWRINGKGELAERKQA